MQRSDVQTLYRTREHLLSCCISIAVRGAHLKTLASHEGIADTQMLDSMMQWAHVGDVAPCDLHDEVHLWQRERHPQPRVLQRTKHNSLLSLGGHKAREPRRVHQRLADLNSSSIQMKDLLQFHWRACSIDRAAKAERHRPGAIWGVAACVLRSQRAAKSHHKHTRMSGTAEPEPLTGRLLKSVGSCRTQGLNFSEDLSRQATHQEAAEERRLLQDAGG